MTPALQMLLQIAATCKFLVAEFAGERFLSRMYPLVADEVRDLREGLLATWVLTAIGLGLVMDAGVLLQGRVLGEGLVALRTN